MNAPRFRPVRFAGSRTRAGAVPPCNPPTARLSSRPIQTPVVMPLEKPRNQPSLLLLVVPVWIRRKNPWGWYDKMTGHDQ